jgi:hypothetical protein
MRGIAGGNEQNAIKRQALANLFGDRQVAPVDGIEGAAEEADAHHNAMLNSEL